MAERVPRPPHPFRGAEAALALLCVLAGALFFASLGRLWPLAATNLVADSTQLQVEARRFLTARGFELEGYRSASALTVDDDALDYVESTFGNARTQAWIRAGLPLVQYRVDLKRRGSTAALVVQLHPAGGVLGWSRSVEDDEPGPRLEPEAARELARDAIEVGLRLDLAEWEERASSSTEQVARRDHAFLFERVVSESPELRERIRAVVAGGEVALVRRALDVPAAAERARRAAEAPGRALETVGFVLAVAGCLVALFVFLRRLQAGSATLGRAGGIAAIVFVCLIGTWALETPSLFRNWEPLWPRWVSDFLYLSLRAVEGLTVALLLLVLGSAADALDRESGAHRGRALWTLARGRIDGAVALASVRGFLVGLLCGGAMAVAVLLLQLAGAWTSIQPRGFFFYTLNTASPAATSVLFFLGIALAEELGYRFFGGTWLEALVRRRWIAALVPAVIYGLVHTRFDFLPPAEPWWGRALVLTAVGCVWGWAFLRYDALTVVLSHFTADLFIFNWPRLASGEGWIVATSLATVAVPLVPALVGLVGWVWRRGKREYGP